MSGDNLIQTDFSGTGSRRVGGSEDMSVSKGTTVRGLFSGKAGGYPPLLSPEILRDIDRRMRECCKEACGVDVRTENYIRPKPARASYENLHEAEVRFFELRTENAALKIPPSAPFLVLRAEHRRDYHNPAIVETLYTLTNGISRGNAASNVAVGKNYALDIAPYISQKLFGKLFAGRMLSGPQGYEAWTPQ